jgi:hypothetical protein
MAHDIGVRLVDQLVGTHQTAPRSWGGNRVTRSPGLVRGKLRPDFCCYPYEYVT